MSGEYALAVLLCVLVGLANCADSAQPWQYRLREWHLTHHQAMIIIHGHQILLSRQQCVQVVVKGHILIVRLGIFLRQSHQQYPRLPRGSESD